MRFDSAAGTPVAGGEGCHPLYASLDHVAPGRGDHGYQIVCYDLNDLKGHIPPILFNALRQSPEWSDFMKAWKKQADKDSDNRRAFKDIVKKGAP